MVPVILWIDAEPNLKILMWLSLRQKSTQVNKEFYLLKY